MRNQAYISALILTSIGFFLGLNFNTLKGQVSDVHLDISYNLDFFTNYDNLDIDTPDNGFAIRGGLNWILKKNENLRLGMEVGFSQRSVVRRLGESKSEVRFRAIDISPILTWHVYKDLSTEFGLGFSMYDAALYVNSVARKLGEGFHVFDIYGSAGFTYNFHKNASLGSRVRYGFVPALKYEPIDDYGEMNGTKNVLNQLTLELFIRFRFYQRKQ